MNDLISRRAALKACKNPEYGENVYAYGDDIEKRLKALPSVSFENHAEIKSYSKDTISRRAAVSGISDLLMFELKGERLPTYNEVYRAIYDLPPAQPGWIPVTERLPTENGSYLAWMPFTPEGHHITVAEWCGSYWNIKTPITAWMYLPKPWEGGQDEK